MDKRGCVVVKWSPDITFYPELPYYIDINNPCEYAIPLEHFRILIITNIFSSFEF